MTFNSVTFLLFIAIILPLYWLAASLRRGATVQALMLVTGSFVFYGYGSPWLALLLAASLTVNSVVSKIMLSSDDPRRRQWVGRFGIAVNLAFLFAFKYADFVAGIILPESLYEQVSPVLQSIPLPVGISFYTFQGISLVMDLKRERRDGLESLIVRSKKRGAGFHLHIWLFISFFPQLVAGPIVKAHDFVNQIGRKHFSVADLACAIRYLITGYFLKSVCADNLREITPSLDSVVSPALSSLDLVAQMYVYSFRIFADFAGYSLIAIGLGHLFGYRLPVNFRYPYLAASLTEFWHRWHISLSSWLRDYLYIPLGGSRSGKARTYVNIFLVMFLGGLWHGASWNFAIWGVGHGFLLAFERWRGIGRSPMSGARLWLGRFATFHLVTLLWLPFALHSPGEALAYVSHIAKGVSGVWPRLYFGLACFASPVVLFHLYGLAKEMGHKLPTAVEDLLLGILLAAIVLNSSAPGTFIYFQF
jgi:alginate O-acetyltransferase complex protein AlgI